MLTFSVNIAVAKVFNEGWGAIRFRRNLFGETTQMWYRLKDLCAQVKSNNVNGNCRWLLEKNVASPQACVARCLFGIFFYSYGSLLDSELLVWWLCKAFQNA
jgi:hypothetical protein